MAIKKFIIQDKTITYRVTEVDSKCTITATDALQKVQTLTLSHNHIDLVTGSLFFEIDGKPYKAHVSNDLEQQAWQVSFAHRQNPITVQKYLESVQIIPAVHANSSHISPQTASQTTLKSPLAGRVSKILVTPAQRVEKGQPLALIESMKMENEICAPRSVFIKTIFIAEGNVVQQNQVLIDFECEGEADATAKNADEQKTVQNR